MSQTQTIRIQDHFSELTDPRRHEVTYPLINIVVIALCAVICGADDFVAIAKYGRTRRDWFAKFLPPHQNLWVNSGSGRRPRL